MIIHGLSTDEKKAKDISTWQSVHVQYDEALRDSTTYTFNFQDAIRDLNEGMSWIISSLSFTGPEIDSLCYGNVYNALSLDAPKRPRTAV